MSRITAETQLRTGRKADAGLEHEKGKSVPDIGAREPVMWEADVQSPLDAGRREGQGRSRDRTRHGSLKTSKRHHWSQF